MLKGKYPSGVWEKQSWQDRPFVEELLHNVSLNKDENLLTLWTQIFKKGGWQSDLTLSDVTSNQVTFVLVICFKVYLVSNSAKTLSSLDLANKDI